MSARYAKDQPSGFSNRIERVAIAGATGTLGGHIIRELLKTGKHTVTGLTRIGSSSTKLPEGVKHAAVNYEDEQSLVAALAGQQFLIIALSVMIPEGTNSRLIRAAATAGVPYIMPNCFGSDIANEKLMVETLHGVLVRQDVAEIEALGVSSWTAMVCGLWYEYSLAMGPAWFGFDFANRKLTYYDDGNTNVNVSTWEQCARAAAALVSLKELPDDEGDRSPALSNWRNKPLYIASFLVSQRDIFESWKRVSGDRDEDWTFDSEGAVERYERGIAEMGQGSVVGRAVAMFSRIFFPNGDGNHEWKYGLDNGVLGLPMEDLDERTKVAKGMIDRGYAAEVMRKTFLESTLKGE